MSEDTNKFTVGWIAKLRRAKSYLRLHGFDQSTPEGRDNERHRRIALTALASAIAKVAGLAVAFVSLPLTYRYLGVERYELWVTLSTTVAMLTFADLGIGSGLLNLISKAYGENDSAAAAKAVSSASFMLLLVGGVLLIGFGSFCNFVPWARLFKVVSADAAAELLPSVKILFGCFLVNLILGTVTRIQLGYQEGYVNSLWQIVGSLLALLGLLTAIHFHAGLPLLILMLAGAPAAASLTNALVLFGYRRPLLAPRRSNVSRSTVFLLGRMGSFFFVLQVTFALAFLSDNLIAKNILPSGSVADYSSVARLFSIAPLVLEMFFAPLWPAYSEAAARRDTGWIKATLMRSLTLGICFSGLMAFVLFFFGKQIIHLWISPELSPPFLLLLGWALWSVIAVVGSATAMFLNGCGAIRFQAVCAVLMSIAAVLLKIFFARKIGLPGIIWGTIVAYLIFTGLPIALYVPRLLTRLKPESFH